MDGKDYRDKWLRVWDDLVERHVHIVCYFKVLKNLND